MIQPQTGFQGLGTSRMTSIAMLDQNRTDPTLEKSFTLSIWLVRWECYLEQTIRCQQEADYNQAGSAATTIY
jgi:hypothetical protein